MSVSTRIVATLKRELKAQGLTYRELALRLSLSESAVKHMFSTGNFSLKRLDAVCNVLELDLGELSSRAEAQRPKLEQLPPEHEQEIVSDTRFLLVTYCLLNFWNFEDILVRYDVSRADGLKYLRRLDRMNLIELLPGDRVRLLVANNFQWRPGGDMERYFTEHVQTDFFAHDFNEEGAIRVAKNGMLSAKGQALLREKLESVGELFDDATWEERRLPAGERRGTTLVLAMRRWVFEAFRELEREPSDDRASARQT